MANKYIATYYCLPHLLLPIPILVLLPAVMHSLQLPLVIILLLVVATMLCLSYFLLSKLPNLFERGYGKRLTKRNLTLGRGFMLVIPLVMAIFAYSAGTHSTVQVSFQGLGNTILDEYYSLALPSTPSFPDLIVVEENRSIVGRDYRQELVISVPYGELDGARVFLIEKPESRFGRQISGDLPEDKYARSYSSMVGGIETRFNYRAQSGRLIVKRISQKDLPAEQFQPSDILLHWNLETPEHDQLIYILFTVIFYVFPYCLIFVFSPLLCAKEDSKAVSLLLEERNFIRRLFSFVRPTH